MVEAKTAERVGERASQPAADDTDLKKPVRSGCTWLASQRTPKDLLWEVVVKAARARAQTHARVGRHRQRRLWVGGARWVGRGRDA